MYLSDARQHESYIVRLGKSNIIFNTNDSIIYKICDGDIVNADIKEIIYSQLCACIDSANAIEKVPEIVSMKVFS